MKRATSTPAGLNVKKITAYLKGQAKSRNAVRITCQSGSVYIITGYAAFKLPVVLYRDVIQPVTMQDAPADGVTIVSSDAGFVVNDPHQLTAAQMFQKFSACKEEVKRTSILQEVEAKGKVWGTFRMFRNGSRPIMINSEYPLLHNRMFRECVSAPECTMPAPFTSSFRKVLLGFSFLWTKHTRLRRTRGIQRRAGLSKFPIPSSPTDPPSFSPP